MLSAETTLYANAKIVVESIKYIHAALVALGYTHDQITTILIAYINGQLSIED